MLACQLDPFELPSAIFVFYPLQIFTTHGPMTLTCFPVFDHAKHAANKQQG